jgi:hypothetical protein
MGIFKNIRIALILRDQLRDALLLMLMTNLCAVLRSRHGQRKTVDVITFINDVLASPLSIVVDGI